MVGVTPIDIELSIVVADGWSPNTLAMLRLVEEFLGFLFLQGIADDFPVYQILAMKDRQTGNAVERTCREIIIIAYSYHIRVAIVGINHGIGISAVAIVGIPNL